MILGISVIAAFFMSTLAFFYLTTPEWSTEVVFIATPLTELDMVIDSHGNPNIASADSSLKLIRKTDNGWNATTLNGSWYTYDYYSGVSIVLDSQDSAYVIIGYNKNDYSYPGLIIATNRDGAWTVEDIPLDYDKYMSSCVAVDDDERIHILCSCVERIDYDPHTAGYDYYAGHLIHIQETPDGWEHSEVFDPTLNSTSRVHSFKIGAGNSMHALLETTVYSDVTYFLVASRSLHYISTVSGDWTQEVVASIDPESLYKTWYADAPMAIDNDGKAHICRYMWDNLTGSYSIAYMTNKYGGWSLRNLTYAGNVNWPPSSCTIDVDSTGSAHIAYCAHYYDYNTSREPQTISNNTVRYVTNRGGSWRQEILDDNDAYRDMIRLAIGSDDAVHISYIANLPRGTGGDDYRVLHTTPAAVGKTLENALAGASVYTLAFTLVVGAIVLIFVRRVERGRKSNQSSQNV